MKRIAILDCAIRKPSFGCINRLSDHFERPFHIHWPSLYGLGTLVESNEADAYIIFGSFSDVIDREPWQAELADFALTKLKENKPVFGICFGHQLMADKFGLKVDKIIDPNLKEGTREVEFIESSLGFQKGDKLEIVKAHSYEVKNKNDEFIHFLTSKECSIDGIQHKSLPFWSVQGHPEASDAFIKNNLEVPPDKDKLKKSQEDGLKLIAGFLKEVEKF